MIAPRRKILPPELDEGLTQLAKEIAAGAPPAEILFDRVIAGLGALPPGSVVRASWDIAEALRGADPPRHWAKLDPNMTMEARQASWDAQERNWAAKLRTWTNNLLNQNPRLAWLLLFHGSGYVREVALDGVHEPPASPFFFAALAWRLNDWVKEIRNAARRCTERVLAGTDANVAAQSALVLLERGTAWGRWQGEAAALDAAFGRRDVITILARALRDGSVGRQASCLGYAMRFPAMDRHLPELAASAAQPGVRAIAYAAVLAGKASWLTGFGWVWVDKSLGVRKRVPTSASRAIPDLPSRADLIRQGLKDRSARIRVLAADALVTDRSYILDSDVLMQRLALDRSAAVRSRADFMRRHPLPQT